MSEEKEIKPEDNVEEALEVKPEDAIEKTEDPEVETKKESPEEEKPEEKKEKEKKVEMVEIPKSRLEELETVEEKALEKIKLETANAINYRKRIDKQKEDAVEFASAKILSKLIVIKDDLKRILENGKEDIPDNHYQGIEMLNQRINDLFKQENVKLMPIKEGKTAYDPRFHEAILAQPVEGMLPNIILTVVSNGFQMKDRVLKPAQVIISKEIPKPKEEKKEEPEEKPADEMKDEPEEKQEE